MRLWLVAFVLISFSMTSFAAPKAAKSENTKGRYSDLFKDFPEPQKKKKKRKSKMKVASFESLQKLPTTQIAAYIRELRSFIKEQEAKKVKFSESAQAQNKIEQFREMISQFGLLDQAFAAPVQGPPVPISAADDQCYISRAGLSRYQKSFLDTNDKCIVGGFVICLTLTNKRIRCTIEGNAEYRAYAKSQGCAEDQIACAPPLYLKADGSTLCLPKSGKRVTDTCEDSKEGLDIDKLAEYIKANGSKYVEKYEDVKTYVEAYCGANSKSKHFNDEGDCAKLTTRLDTVLPYCTQTPIPESCGTETSKVLAENPPASEKDGLVCKARGTLPPDFKKKNSDTSLTPEITLSRSRGQYSLDRIFPDTKWSLTECEERTGFVVDKASYDRHHRIIRNATKSEKSMSMCYAKWNSDKDAIQTYQVAAPSIDKPECRIVQTNSRKGKWNKDDRICEVKVNGKKLKFEIDPDGTRATTEILKGEPIIFARRADNSVDTYLKENEEQGTSTNLRVENDKCYVSEQTGLGTDSILDDDTTSVPAKPIAR